LLRRLPLDDSSSVHGRSLELIDVPSASARFQPGYSGEAESRGMSSTATRTDVQSKTTIQLCSWYAGATDGELVNACGKGDQLAWNSLVRRHSPRLRSIARFSGLDAAAAEDVVQTSWSSLYRSLDRLANADAVGGWLSTTVKREAIRVSRAQRRTRVAELPPSDLAPPDERLIEREPIVALRGAFDRLPADGQELLRLLFSDAELSYGQIAERIGRSVGSIGPTRARCLARLRALLDQDPMYRSDPSQPGSVTDSA
jgi:RNA polymerase sigma factor (sigma-70 family)